MSDKPVLEICTESLDHAIAAERANANRIELCTNLAAGGVTPSAGVMEAARRHLRVPIHVLIRPRPGDFVYSAHEFEVMRNDIRVAKQLGMNGIAVGILDSRSRIDVNRTRELCKLAHPLKVTFHRAFDQAGDFQESLEQVVEIGAQRILTSGRNPRAADSIPILAHLVKLAAGRITIMPGGGVTEENVVELIRATAAQEIHTSAGASGNENFGQGHNSCDLAEYEARVRRVKALLEDLGARG